MYLPKGNQSSDLSDLDNMVDTQMINAVIGLINYRWRTPLLYQIYPADTDEQDIDGLPFQFLAVGIAEEPVKPSIYLIISGTDIRRQILAQGPLPDAIQGRCF